MGGLCSRMRDQPVMKGAGPHELSSRYCKSGSSKWLTTSFCRPAANGQRRWNNFPSLLELCIHKIRQVIVYFRSMSFFSGKHMIYLPLMGHCNRTLTHTIHFQCCQEMLVNRYSTIWYIPIVLLMFLLRLSGTVIFR